MYIMFTGQYDTHSVSLNIKIVYYVYDITHIPGIGEKMSDKILAQVDNTTFLSSYNNAIFVKYPVLTLNPRFLDESCDITCR